MPIWHIADMDSNDSRSALLRIVDANFNRASEGLRVVEDIVRLVRDDRYLTQLCKQMRHELADAMSCCPVEQLHALRDTIHDVGTQIGVTQEYARPDTGALLSANFKRVQQSLRCLEESIKLLQPSLAQRRAGAWM